MIYIKRGDNMTTLMQYMDETIELKLKDIQKYLRPHLNVNRIFVKNGVLTMHVDNIRNEHITGYVEKINDIKSSNNLKSVIVTTRGE